MEQLLVSNQDLVILQQRGFFKNLSEADAIWKELKNRCPIAPSILVSSREDQTSLVIPPIRGDLKPNEPVTDICIAYSSRNGASIAKQIQQGLSSKNLRARFANDEQNDWTKIETIVAESICLVVLLTEKSLQEADVVFAMTAAKYYFKQLSQIILVHDAASCFFPGSNEQPSTLQEVFSEKAITYLSCYSENGIDQIIEKFQAEKAVLKNSEFESNDNAEKEENIQTRIFLSHKRSTGQGIAGRLYNGLQSDFSVFLDSEAKFKIHNLNKIVEKTLHFVFILSPGILLSQWCLEELKSAVANRKQISIVRDLAYVLPAELPLEWQPFESILRTPDELIWIAEYNQACVEAIRSRTGPPDTDYNLAISKVPGRNQTVVELFVQQVEETGTLNLCFTRWGNALTLSAFIFMTRNQPEVWNKIKKLAMSLSRDNERATLLKGVKLPNVEEVGWVASPVLSVLDPTKIRQIGLNFEDEGHYRFPNIESYSTTVYEEPGKLPLTETCGDSVKSLTLEVVEVAENWPVVLTKYKKLETLTVKSYSPAILFSGPFPSVSSLTYSYALGDLTLKCIKESFPSLKSLSIEGLREGGLQLAHMLAAVDGTFDRVELLDLTLVSFTMKDITALVTAFPDLHTLRLCTKGVTLDADMPIFQDLAKLPNLKHVFLPECHASTSQLLSLVPIAAKLESLEVWVFQSALMDEIANHGDGSLKHLGITSLDDNCTFNLSSPGFKNLEYLQPVRNFMVPDLLHLSKLHTIQTNGGDFETITELLPQLKDLSAIHTAVTPKAIEIVIEKARNLESLHLLFSEKYLETLHPDVHVSAFAVAQRFKEGIPSLKNCVIDYTS